MVTNDLLSEIATRITAHTNAERVILFGSHAWGEASEDSDVALLVVVPDSSDPPHRRAAQIHRILRGVAASCDVIVRTREELSRLNPTRASLLYRALTEGKRLDG